MCPDFSKLFEVFADAFRCQFGAATTQGERVTAFFSRELNNAQHNCTAVEHAFCDVDTY
jgi:hypothetical protein